MPANAVTCARLGCHGLAAVTALTVQDTAGIEEIHPVSPDLLDDQARCLLEDMSVQAIKVGGLYTAETASVAAQIAADYNQVPLVLHLGQRAQLPPTDAADEDDADDLLAATLELVLPQTDLLVIEHLRLAQWHADGDIDIGDAPTPMHALVAAGAQWVLVLGSPQRPGHYANVLLGPGGQTSTYPWQAPPDRNGDAGGGRHGHHRHAGARPGNARGRAAGLAPPTPPSPPASCLAWAGAFPTGSNRNESPAFSRRPVRRDARMG